MAQDRERQLLVWAIITVQFASPFMGSGVAVAIPSIGSELNAGATSLGLVETIYLASTASFLLPVGRLAAAGGKNALCKVGLLSFALSTILIGLLSSMPIILTLRFVQGISSAAVSATAPAILADLIPAAERGKAYGRSMGAVYAGLTLGPMCAGLLTEMWGWRAVFLVSGAALFSLYLVLRSMMPTVWHRPPAGTVHVPSAALVFATVLCLVAGSATVRQGPVGYAYIGGAVVLAAIFVFLQRRLTQPLVNIDVLWRNRVLASALFIQLMLYLNGFCVTFLLSIYMQVSLHQSADTAGEVLAVGTVLMAVMAPVAGRLSDRYAAHRISALGIACVLASTVMGLLLDERSSLWFVFVLLSVQGLGWAAFSAPNMATIMNSVPASATSIASALGAMARSLGMLCGMVIAGVFISLFIGNEPIGLHPKELVGIMVATFSVLSVATAAILVLSLMAGTRRSQTV